MARCQAQIALDGLGNVVQVGFVGEEMAQGVPRNVHRCRMDQR